MNRALVVGCLAAVLWVPASANAMKCIAQHEVEALDTTSIIEGTVAWVNSIERGSAVGFHDVRWIKGEGADSVWVYYPSGQLASGGIIAGGEVATPGVGGRWRISMSRADHRADRRWGTSACDRQTSIPALRARSAEAAPPWIPIVATATVLGIIALGALLLPRVLRRPLSIT